MLYKSPSPDSANRLTASFGTRLVAVGSAIALMWVSPAFGQEEVDDIVQSEGGVQSRMIVASSDDSGAAPMVAFMSSSEDGEMGMPMMLGAPGMSMPAPDIFSLANNKSVQNEIELVDDQLKQLKEINKKFSQQMQEKIKAMTSGDSINRQSAGDLTDMIAKFNEEKRNRMNEVLLPHQLERLRQISVQTHMKQSGESAMLTSNTVVEALDLTADQQERLKERSEELKAEMEAEIKKLKEKARKELFKELSDEQQTKLEKLLGADFELKQEDFMSRFKTRGKKMESKKSDR